MFVVAVLTIFLATQSLCSVRVQDSEVTRQIFGSNGPYRDFARSDCSQPVETGRPCGEWQYAYHWNHNLKECERTIYHGCNPSRNNFRTIRDCNTQAKSVCT